MTGVESDSLSEDDSPPSASVEFDIVIDGKHARCLEKRNISLSQYSFERFIQTAEDIACKKGKISKNDIANFEAKFSWIWLSVAKSQARTLPRFNSLETAENYAQIRADIATHYKVKKHLNNMVLRIKIEIRKDGNAFDALDEYPDFNGTRPVGIHSILSDYRRQLNQR